jgi:hypothetical protein
MAHFAQLNNDNYVIEVIVVDNENIENLPFPESEPVGIAFCQSLLGEDTNWAQTSYNGSFRYNFATIGSFFDYENQAFIPVKPFSSWLLNTDNFIWEAPTPYPSEGGPYFWDEETLSWK